MDISAGVVVREGQLVRKGPELVSEIFVFYYVTGK